MTREAATPPSGGSLRADRVAHVRESLAESLAAERGSGLDDAGRVDAIRALEELICTASAAQALLARELDASQRAAQAAAGVPAERQGRGVSAQVALARRESPHRGQRHLGLAKIVPVELPHTWAAWTAGRITEWAVTVIARETACLEVEHRLAVDCAIAGDPNALEALGLGELTGRVRSLAEQADPAAAVKRRRNAEVDRHVSIRPAPDTMCWLTALLPVQEGVAAFAALTQAADTARAAGDPRSKGQLMADALVGAVADATQPSGGGTAAGTGVEVCVVMSDAALFGESEEPAHLVDWGPVPAELAREIVADSLTTTQTTWLRRVYADPTTGELVSADSARRRFPASMARFIKLRDQQCRTPWCDAPIRHSDHAADHHTGGATSLANGQGLCEACNHAKQAPGWRARPRPGPGHTIETCTPTGHTYTTRPPTRATITRRPMPQLVMDLYVRAS